MPSPIVSPGIVGPVVVPFLTQPPGRFRPVTPDVVTIATVTVVSSAEAFTPADDGATVGGITDASQTTDVEASIDIGVVDGVTTLVGSYLSETFTIHTTDYNWSPWTIAYSSDGSLQPVYGCVGSFNDDTGRLV